MCVCVLVCILVHICIFCVFRSEVDLGILPWFKVIYWGNISHLSLGLPIWFVFLASLLKESLVSAFWGCIYRWDTKFCLYLCFWEAIIELCSLYVNVNHFDCWDMPITHIYPSILHSYIYCSLGINSEGKHHQLPFVTNIWRPSSWC